MASIAGTNVASPIRPFTDEDKFATAFSNEIKGGRHTALSLTARNNIYRDRREVGMECYVIEIDKTFKLITNPSTEATTNVDWEEVVPSPDDIVFSDGTSLVDKFAKIDNSIVFNIDLVKVGAHPLEFLCPKKAKVKAISMSISKSTVLTQNVDVKVECFKSNAWESIDSLSLLKTNINNYTSKDPLTQYAIEKFDRVRLNILNCEQGLKNLVVLVTITDN